MNEKFITVQQDDKAPQLEPCDTFVNTLHGYFYESQHRDMMMNFGSYRADRAFEEGARYAIANLGKLVTSSSLLALVEYYHKRSFINNKQRARLIEKFCTMTFSNGHNPKEVIEKLAYIEKMVDAIMTCQCTGQSIIKAPDEEHC